MPITKGYPTEGAEIRNRVREESLAYFQAETHKPLVTELWAIRGKTNEVRVKQIASQSRMPLVWLDKMPSMNGDTGMEKLRVERSVLLLREGQVWRERHLQAVKAARLRFFLPACLGPELKYDDWRRHFFLRSKQKAITISCSVMA